MYKKKRKMKNTTKPMNTVRCTIPGLMGDMDLVFPDRKLPVCEKCKSVFKSRRLCREQDGHTAFPWKKMYICFILDDSCFAADEMGNECLVREDGPNPHDFFAESIECSDTTKYVAKFDSNKLDPICAPCKLKGCTTRPDCREFCGHKYLPWNSIYMRLYAKQSQRIDVWSNRKNVLCLPTSSGYIDDHLVQPTKKMKIGIEDGIRNSLSIIDTRATHYTHLFSSDRNDSKAFLLILSDNKCQLEWLRLKFGTTSSLKGLKEEEYVRSPLQKDMESSVPSKKFECSPSEEMMEPAEKKTMSDEKEKLTIDEIDSQLREINAIESFGSSFDQCIPIQGQDLNFHWTQEERDEEDQQQQSPTINENIKSYPHEDGRSYHDHNKSSQHPVLPMVESGCSSHYSQSIHLDSHQSHQHQGLPHPSNTMHAKKLSTGVVQERHMRRQDGSKNNPYQESFNGQREEDRYRTSNSNSISINKNYKNNSYNNIHNSIRDNHNKKDDGIINPDHTCNSYYHDKNQYRGIPNPPKVSLLSLPSLYSGQHELQQQIIQQQVLQQQILQQQILQLQQQQILKQQQELQQYRVIFNSYESRNENSSGRSMTKYNNTQSFGRSERDSYPTSNGHSTN